jgi:hypothetical protein
MAKQNPINTLALIFMDFVFLFLLFQVGALDLHFLVTSITMTII